MAVRSSFGDHESLCDFAIRKALLYQRGHLEFPFAQGRTVGAAPATTTVVAAQGKIDHIVEPVKLRRGTSPIVARPIGFGETVPRSEG